MVKLNWLLKISFFVPSLVLLPVLCHSFRVGLFTETGRYGFFPKSPFFRPSGGISPYYVGSSSSSSSSSNQPVLLLRVSTRSTDSNSDESSSSSSPIEDDDDEEEDDEDVLHIATKIPTETSPSWELGNDFHQFLNQCTIQSFLFLLKTCRDPQTILWVENYTQPLIVAPRAPTTATAAEETNDSQAASTSAAPATGGSASSKLLTYHGLAAMNTTTFPTWDSYYSTLLEQPVETYIIESWQAHVPSYEMDVNPPSVCSRLISVREQLAREFEKDLTVLANMDAKELLQGYLHQQLLQERLDGGARDTLRSGAAAGSLLFLDDDDEAAYAPSPLRKGNFDLLVLLATQESIHCLLNDVGGSRGSSSSCNDNNDASGNGMPQSHRQFLSNFYLNRLVSHFTGRQRYGRANSFLQELAQSSNSKNSVAQENDGASSSSSPSSVDSAFITEQILARRQKVAAEWAEIAATVPDLHIGIKRLQLDLLMKSYDNTEEDAFL